jgi:Fe-S-cluster containining protein
MIKWRCTLCALCCKLYTPLVLPEDVKRIQESLKLPMSAFITFYRPTDFEGPLDESYQGLLFNTREGQLVMGLSRVDLPEGDVGCVFLKNNLCSIHAHRPYVCRQFPFKPVDEENMEGAFTLMDDPCFGKHATDEVVDENPLRQNYRVFQEKEKDYLSKVREWNEGPESRSKDFADFLYFVGLQWS